MPWERLIIEEDPDWEEWHKVIMSPTKGRSFLKLWVMFNGTIAGSLTSIDGYRARLTIESDNMDDAKKEIEEKGMNI